MFGISVWQGKGLLRALALALFCVALIIFNWRGVLEPQHRPMTLMLLTGALGIVLFCELMLREAAMEWILVALIALMGAGGLVWAALSVFYVPLPNDHAPLLPERTRLTDLGCRVPKNGLSVAAGQSWIAGSASAFVPFRAGTCPGPSLTRTREGLLINFTGYDSSGAIIFRIENNQFSLLLGNYLHMHRPNRSTLALYDKNENEVFYLRYLAPDRVRVRGRFLCGDTAPLTITDSSAAPHCLRGPVPLQSPL
jgi:hypothetical protein